MISLKDAAYDQYSSVVICSKTYKYKSVKSKEARVTVRILLSEHIYVIFVSPIITYIQRTKNESVDGRGINCAYDFGFIVVVEKNNKTEKEIRRKKGSTYLPLPRSFLTIRKSKLS